MFLFLFPTLFSIDHFDPTYWGFHRNLNLDFKDLLNLFQARLIALYYDTERYTDALALGSQLLKELKKLDDKNLLVEVRWAFIILNRQLHTYPLK